MNNETATPTTDSRMGMFKTRNRVQKPVRQFLINPETGELTSEYLDIRSSLSDEFTAARDRSMQEVGEIDEKDPEKRKAAVKEIQLRMSASLVAGWSFDEPCTEENVVGLLREAPQVRNLVNAVADDQQRFFNRPSDGSAGSRTLK